MSAVPPSPPPVPQLAVASADLRALFHGLFENSLDAVMLSDPTGPVLAANPEACRLFRSDEATLCRLGRAGLIDTEDPRIPVLVARRALEGAARGPARMRRVDGELFEAELSSSIFTDATGARYSTLFVRDLEPQRRAEQMLRESEERLRFSLDSAGIAHWDHDLRGNQTRRSALHDRLFGYERPLPSWSLETFLAHVHPDDRAHVETTFQRALERGTDYEVEYRVLRADGGERWLWSKGRVHLGDDGLPSRVAGIRADVHARRLAEIAAAEDRARLAAVIEFATDAMLVADADDRLLVFNPSAEELFGVPARAALGRPLTDFIDLPAPVERLRHRSGVELEGLRHDGSRFEAEASFSLGSAEGGQPMTTVILRDVTQRHALQQAREALDTAESANRAKTNFLAHVSHELRTPLNAVIGFSDLMLHDTASPLPPEHRRRVEHVREAGEHLLAMIGDLLDVARAEAGHLHVELQPVALQTPLAEAVAIVQPIADTARLALQFAADRVPALPVRADPLRLRQVIVNLLGNAIKYNRPRGRIALSAAPAPGGVEIEVADTGIGMSAAQLERLFRPFERVGSERSRIEGTGLGLSLSRQLVDAMGGRLAVASEVGVGSRFTVWLPAA